MWSHYVAAVLLILQLSRNISDFDASNNAIDKYVLIVSVCCGNIFPMFCSAFCHQFYCINKTWHTYCWFLDFIGILTGMLFGGLSFLYLTFYCSVSMMIPLMYIIVVGYILSLQWCWSHFKIRTSKHSLYPYDRFPEFSRFLSLYAIAASGLPLTLTIYFRPEYMEYARLKSVYMASIMGPVLMACGIIFFAQGHIPERFCKPLGLPIHYFDIVGHSHQFWHLVSASLMFCWIYLTSLHLEARLAYGCPA
jgi:hypothetical protein